MYKSLKKVVLLFALIVAVVCTSLFAVACDDDKKGNTKVTYSVTVTTEDTGLDLTSIKAQWLNSDDTAASEEIALNAQGKASVKLEKGNYTVTLKGVSGSYTFENKAVTADNRDATIALTSTNIASHDVTVTVSIPADVTLAADVKAQVKVGGNNFGNPVVISGTSITISVPDEGTYEVEVINLPDYLNAAYTSITGTTGALAITKKAVTYTVNFTAPAGVSLTGVTVTFYNGTDPVTGATNVAVSNNKAEVSIVAGLYTVEANNLPAGYTADPVSVTTSTREVTIAVRAITYKVTLEIPASAAAELDLTTVSVQLKDAAGANVGEPVNFNASGVAEIPAVPGDYTYEIIGLDNTKFMVEAGDFDSDREAIAVVIVIPVPDATTGEYTFYDLGSYYITVVTEQNGATYRTVNQKIKLIVNTAAARSYTVTISEVATGDSVSFVAASSNTAAYVGENKIVFNYDPMADDFSSNFGSDGSINLTLRYTAGAALTATSEFGYIVTVTSDDLPEEGEKLNPIFISKNSYASTFTASGRENAYFEIEASGRTALNSTYTITFASGVTVYSGSDIDHVTVQVFSGSNIVLTAKTYLYVTAPSGQTVEFTLAQYFEPGSTSQSAIQAVVGTEAGIAEAGTVAWFTFTPTSTTGATKVKLYVELGEGFDYSSGSTMSIGSTLDTTGNGVSNAVLADLVPGMTFGSYIGEFTVGTKYYVFVSGCVGLTLSFTISEDYDISDVEDGEVAEKPAELEAENEPDSVMSTYVLMGKNYYTYEVEFLNAEGKVTIDFFSSGLTVKVYNNASFSGTPIGSKAGGDTRVTLSNVAVGDTIYVLIVNDIYERLIDYSINYIPLPPPELNTNSALEVTIKNKTEITLGDSVEGGNYLLSYYFPNTTYVIFYVHNAATFNPSQIASGALLQIGSNGEQLYKGYYLINIPATAEGLIIASNGAGDGIDCVFTLYSIEDLSTTEPSTVSFAPGGEDDGVGVAFKLDSQVEKGVVYQLLMNNVAPVSAEDVQFTVYVNGSEYEIGESFTLPGSCNYIYIYATGVDAAFTADFELYATGELPDGTYRITAGEYIEAEFAPVELPDWKYEVEVKLLLTGVEEGEYYNLDFQLPSYYASEYPEYFTNENFPVSFDVTAGASEGNFTAIDGTHARVEILIPVGCNTIVIYGNSTDNNISWYSIDMYLSLYKQGEEAPEIDDNGGSGGGEFTGPTVLEANSWIRVVAPGLEGDVTIALGDFWIFGGTFKVTVSEAEGNDVTLDIDGTQYTFGMLEGTTKTIEFPAFVSSITLKGSFVTLDVIITLGDVLEADDEMQIVFPADSNETKRVNLGASIALHGAIVEITLSGHDFPEGSIMEGYYGIVLMFGDDGYYEFGGYAFLGATNTQNVEIPAGTMYIEFRPDWPEIDLTVTITTTYVGPLGEGGGAQTLDANSQLYSVELGGVGEQLVVNLGNGFEVGTTYELTIAVDFLDNNSYFVIFSNEDQNGDGHELGYSNMHTITFEYTDDITSFVLFHWLYGQDGLAVNISVYAI